MTHIDKAANARLIAAAPVMLEALKDLTDWAQSEPEGDAYSQEVIKNATVAIALATGEGQ